MFFLFLLPGIISKDYLSPCKLMWRKKAASMNFRGDEMLNLISVLGCEQPTGI